MDKQIVNELGKRGVLAVLEFTDVEQAVPVAQALIKGGITAIELALRTDAAEASIKAISENVPEMLIGIGTVIKSGQAERVKNLGAHFGVSPGFNPKIVREAQRVGLPFAPGISTASELEWALDEGCDVLKLFPAEPLGGIKYLEAMSGPYNYLNLKFIPLGGISLSNLKSWAENKNVLAIGGTWIAKKDLIIARNYEQIEKNAKEAVALWNEVRH